MGTTSIVAVTNRVTKDDNDSAVRNRQLGDRAAELAGLGQMGYTPAHPAVIEGTESVTFVDTLTRINDKHPEGRRCRPSPRSQESRSWHDQSPPKRPRSCCAKVSKTSFRASSSA